VDEILAFDRAESLQDSAYLGQINMITVSSFCGIQGRVWGLELFPAEGLRAPHSAVNKVAGVSVYDASPLLDASRDLFGTVAEKKFPLIPGAHVPTAAHSIEKKGPEHLYGAIAFGIPEDRSREAILFMEDVGTMTFDNTTDVTRFEQEKRTIIEKLALSVLEVGKNQHITYKEIYITFKDIAVGFNEVGCALIAVPYVTLAKNAVSEKIVVDFENLSLNDWKREVDVVNG